MNAMSILIAELFYSMCTVFCALRNLDLPRGPSISARLVVPSITGAEYEEYPDMGVYPSIDASLAILHGRGLPFQC